MNKPGIRIITLVVCLTLLFGVIPAQAGTLYTEYVTREEAVAGILEKIGLESLNDTESDLSAFSDSHLINPEYIDEIGIAVTNGIIAGSGKALEPRRSVTRLEFAMFLSRSIRDLPFVNDIQYFADVPDKTAGDVNKVVRAGLLYGYGNGSFGANDYLTRQQLAAVLERLESLPLTKPQDDFYYSVNREWFMSVKLPAGYPGLSAFDEVDLANGAKLKAIVRDVYTLLGTYSEGSKEQKIADFYSTIMDMENRNKQAIEPIQKYLNRFENVGTIQELLDQCAVMENETGINPLFSFSPSGDIMDSSKYSLYGTGLSTLLPQTYMLSENPQVRILYEDFLAQMLELSGIKTEKAAQHAQSIYDFEIVLAENTMTREQSSRIENIYNPVTRDNLIDMFSHADIDSYLNGLGYNSVDSIIITDLKLMGKTGELLCEENLEVLKAYVRARIMVNTASCLSKELQDTIDAFNNTFLGTTGTVSEEDRAFNMLNSVMSDYLGKIYVEEYFSEEAKKDVENIVADIIAAYRKRLENLEWMSDSTKTAAISKLQSIKTKIGYPETWEDPLENVRIKTYAEGGSLLSNIFAISSAQVRYSKTLLDKPVDKTKWAMPPHTVNAYYSATNNEIVFPAGILQPPFYDVNASREKNLGGIGSIIAHEITHAFDNNGAQFDENGNMSNWWTEEDYRVFQQKCRNVIHLYDGLEIAPNAIVSGDLTVSENVADIGAMACVLDIMKDIPNANYKDLFESYATIWRMTATPQMHQFLTTQDVHSPSKFRSNQVVRNFQEFYDTYGIDPEDGMYLPPEKRVSIW